MTLTLWSITVGLACCVITVVITVCRQRAFEYRHIGSYTLSFLSGTNMPIALKLVVAGMFPDAALSASTLSGLEKYVSFAGIAFLLATLIAIWSQLRSAWIVTSE